MQSEATDEREVDEKTIDEEKIPKEEIAKEPIQCRRSHNKPDMRRINATSSNALKLMDKAIKFSFRTDEDCMKWVVRNINMLSDEDQAPFAELIKCNDAYEFVEMMYKLYTAID